MNQPRKQQALSGWGNYSKAEYIAYRPEKQSDVTAVVQEGSSLIARGHGHSYGNASLNKNGVMLPDGLDKFLNFDEKEGVTLAEILDVTIPKGWILPAIPSTKNMSAGGAFACNINGKNHSDSAHKIYCYPVLT
jgi:FAD/FMN-containing dehydrogenase